MESTGNKTMVRDINKLDLKVLHLFKVIVDCGGFSQAQEKLGTQQSTISTNMASLERQLGMTLCQRGRKGFKLTLEGEKFYQFVETLFTHIRDFEVNIQELQMQSQGYIRFAMIDCVVTNPDCLLTRALERLRQEFPLAKIDSRVEDTLKIEELLLAKELDIAITSSEIRRDGLEYIEIFSEYQSLYCRAEHPILKQKQPLTLDSLKRYAIVDRATEHKITPVRDFGCEVFAYTSNMEMTALLLLSSDYIGHLPEHFAELWVQRGELIKLDIPNTDYKTEFHLTQRKDVTHPDAVAYLVEQLKDVHAFR
ncbi:TPA: LysR family transcriptional regulator [Photobacterium damselae]